MEADRVIVETVIVRFPANVRGIAWGCWTAYRILAGLIGGEPVRQATRFSTG